MDAKSMRQTTTRATALDDRTSRSATADAARAPAGAMRTDRRLGRYLGAAYLWVFAGSLLSGVLSWFLSGATGQALVGIAENPARTRLSALSELVITSVGIVALAVLLYMAVREGHRIASLVALGWWFAEAILLAVSAIALFLLIPVGEAYVDAGPVAAPSLLALGDALIGLREIAYSAHMVFFALGGLVWYSLMYRLGSVPRRLSLFGVAAVALALIATLGSLIADLDLFVLGVPTGVFELVIAGWVIARGIRRPTPDHAGPVTWNTDQTNLTDRV